MKVLLTGGSGFLGRHVLQALRAQGITTVVIGRQCPVGLDAAHFVPADLTATTQLDALVRSCSATHLLHLAWVTGHTAYWESPLNLRWVDTTTRLVQSFCAAGGRKVVVAGSCAEYSWEPGGMCAEDSTPLAPATLYGVAKDATRRLLQAWCARHGVACAWARVFFPFGAGEDPRRLVPALFAALRGHAAPFGVNALSQRDFLHADDVAAALLTLLSRDASGAYNVSSGVATPIATVVETIARHLGASAQTILSLPAAHPGGPAVLAGDNRRLRALGWEPHHTLEQGVVRAAQQVPEQAHDHAH